MNRHISCPYCGGVIERYRNPLPTVDIIIEMAPSSHEPAPGTGAAQLEARAGSGKEGGIVLIKRKNPPFGWALPGGFVDYGESLESAAIREAEEETSLKIKLLYQLGAYSDPSRDPRHHTITVVFVAGATGTPRPADDAENVGVFHPDSLPDPLAFDHAKILRDYFERCYQKN